MSTSRPVLREGEWACVDARCSYINTIHHSSCQACGRRKPRGKGTVGQAIGKDAAEKSKGLFEAEDWCCSKCGNINWARRATCNICNAKKFAEVEARTGYGGGYMDRQQVEYIPRNESEEEYDEFGRLKGKRKRTNEKHDSGYENLDEKKGKMENYDKERPEEEYKGHDMEREEEEEDDDDEDGDLSKYQLGKYDFEKPLSKRRSRHRSPKRRRRRSSGSDDRSASPSRSRSGSYSSSTRDGSSGSDKSYSRSSGSYRGSSVSSRRSSSSSSRSRGRRSARHHSRSGKYRDHLYRRREKYRSKSSVTSTSGTESSRSDRSSESSSYSSSPSRDSYRHSRHRRQRRR